MTEDEAKTKWCPMVRCLVYNAQGSGAANQAYVDEVVDINLAMCKGSLCMMWRQTYTDTAQFGYCGLAGKPDG